MPYASRTPKITKVDALDPIIVAPVRRIGQRDIQPTQVKNRLLEGIDAAIITTGVISTARLGTGTANSGTVLHGDNTWSAAGSGDLSSNTSTSVDSEVALFSSTTGKIIKRATGSGIAKLTSGVLSVVTAPTGTILGTSDAQNVTNKTLDATNAIIATAITSGTLPAGRLPALTGDVTTTVGTVATTLAAIQGTTVSGVTGTGNVVFSSAPTLTNPVVGTQSSADNSTKAASTAYVTSALAAATTKYSRLFLFMGG